MPPYEWSGCCERVQRINSGSFSGMSPAELIKAHVISDDIQPVRERCDSVVVVRAGDVHRKMGVSNILLSVCEAIWVAPRAT